MPETRLSLTPAQTLGLFFIQRYRFLTIAQVAKAAGLSKRHAEDVLHAFLLRRIVGHFGNVTIPGHGKICSMDAQDPYTGDTTVIFKSAYKIGWVIDEHGEPNSSF